MSALGNKIQSIEVPSRNHVSLITDINKEDDQIANAIEVFLKN